MKKLTEYITITELAPLLGVTRPTLYKYMVDYENGDVRHIKYEIIIIFDYIAKVATNKVDIINFINQQKEGTDASLLKEIKEKMDSNQKFKELIILLLRSHQDYAPLLVDLKEKGDLK